MFCKYVTYGWGSPNNPSSIHDTSIKGSGRGKTLGFYDKSCSASPGLRCLLLGKGRGLNDVVDHDTEYGCGTEQEVAITNYLDWRLFEER